MVVRDGAKGFDHPGAVSLCIDAPASAAVQGETPRRSITVRRVGYGVI
jgi:hypothetical protein